MPDSKPADLNPANIVANLPESGILQTAAGWFWRCGPVLNPPKEVFSAGYFLLILGNTCCPKSSWSTCLQKLVINSLNLQYLLLILLGSLLSAPSL
jgi:hypothetical protein